MKLTDWSAFLLDDSSDNGRGAGGILAAAGPGPPAVAGPSSAEGGHTFRSAHGPRALCTMDMQGVVASITDTLAPNHKNIR